MKIQDLISRPEINKDVKLNKAYVQLEKLINELRNKELSDEVVDSINVTIEELNSISGKGLRNQIKKRQSKIISLIEKEHKIVPKNHYRNTWLAIGMVAFGMPLGIAFGASLGNMGYLGIGLPIGLAIGIAIGTKMDKKAFEEGRQLSLELE